MKISYIDHDGEEPLYIQAPDVTFWMDDEWQEPVFYGPNGEPLYAKKQPFGFNRG